MAWIKRHLGTLLLIVLGCGAYLNSLSAPAVFDDELSLVRNTYIRQLWPPKWFWGAQYESSLSTRPLVALSFAINYAMTGLAPWAMRATNVAIHSASALVLWAWLQALTADRKGPPKKRSQVDADTQRWQSFGLWCIAAVWLVHPLQTDAVTYLMQRTELMVGLAFFAVMWTAARSPDTSWSRWHTWCVAWCLVGVGCKEVIATAPVLVILADRAFRYDSWSATWRRRWLLYLGLVATWVPLAVLMRLMPRSDSVGFHLDVTPWQYLLTQCHAIPMYLRQSIWPSGLCIDHGEIIQDAVLEAVPGGLLLLTLLGITIWSWFVRPVWGFVGAWFFIILGPTSSILPIVTEVAAERRMHLPLLSVIVAASCAGQLILARLPGWRALSLPTQRRTSASIAAAVIVVFTGLTMVRNYDYRSEVAIWTDAVAKVPNNYRAHSCLSFALHRSGDLKGAEQSTRNALKLATDHYLSAMNLVIILDQMNRHDEADRVIEDYSRNNPRDVVGWFTFAGQRAVKLQRYADAERLFGLVLKASPTDFTAINELGGLMVLLKRYDEAIELAKRAIAVEPQNSLIRENLGLLLAQLGRPQEAVVQLREAVRIDPQRLDAKAWLDNHAAKSKQP
jgi:tetratricopeptide (TPR) repeat protein